MLNQKNTSKETVGKANCCGTCGCDNCSCGCPGEECRCQAANCQCGCRAPRNRE